MSLANDENEENLEKLFRRLTSEITDKIISGTKKDEIVDDLVNSGMKKNDAEIIVGKIENGIKRIRNRKRFQFSLADIVSFVSGAIGFLILWYFTSYIVSLFGVFTQSIAEKLIPEIPVGILFGKIAQVLESRVKTYPFSYSG